MPYQTDNIPELLSPAGDMSCLVAAVQNGADAVYFGGSLFNARRGAGNFSGDELEKAVDYCRLRRVNTYVTLNTLLFDREIDQAMAFAKELYEAGVTAVIVQDVGLAALIGRDLPGLAVHASTQMGVHNIEGLRYCERNGIKRAVLSRETSLDEIRRMHGASPVELEFFCHGALCMGFSGSCLCSSMAGERSGNRGTCAQPCRKNASVLDVKRAGADEFCLSTNDICMIDELRALADAGVSCLKIEGRMKQPEYVAAVTRIYRAALDALKTGERFDSARAKRELFAIFNRGDFSTSHLYSDSVRTGRTGHAQPPRELIARAHESVRGENRARPAELELDITVGRPARLVMRLAEAPAAAASAEGPVCEAANRPVDPERVAEQMKKLGSTVFFAQSCSVKGEGFIPASALNAMRREAAEKLEKALLASMKDNSEPAPGADFAPAAEALLAEAKAPEAPLKYVRVRTAEAAKRALESGADYIGIDPWQPGGFDAEALKGLGGRFVLIMPNVLITRGAVGAYLRLLESGAFVGAEVNNIGGLELLRPFPKETLPMRIAGIGMNVMNSFTAKKLLSEGLTHIMPSVELTRAQLAAMSRGLGPVMILNTYLRTPLMQLMHCPVREYRGCRGCRGSAGAVTDGEGRRFPLVNTRFPGGREGYCLVRMLNNAVTDIRKQAEESGIAAFAFAETPDEEKDPAITRGHWSRAVD